MVISLIHNLDYSPTHHITRCMRYVPAVSTSTFVQMISISLVTKHTDAIKGDARCVREIVNICFAFPMVAQFCFYGGTDANLHQAITNSPPHRRSGR